MLPIWAGWLRFGELRRGDDLSPGLVSRMAPDGRQRAPGLLATAGPDGRSTFNRLKKPAQRAAWSRFKA